MKRWLSAFLISTGSIAAAGAGALLLGEFYNLSAIRQHPAWVYGAIALGRDAVIAVDAAGIDIPDGFAPRATPRNAALFQENCARCHGAPGLPPEDFALAMLPVPTSPVDMAMHRSPAEIYRFVSEGLKMSGMPAWQQRMSEAQMWDVTALVEALPDLSPVEYQALLREAGDSAAPEFPKTSDGFLNPDRGRRLMQQYACRSCHIIPGLVGRDVRVGPRLDRAGSRRYVAGVLPNTPENMVRWIMNPQEVDPLSAMPDLDVPADVAADMAAYLYQLSPPDLPGPPEAER
ncbi:c-type cytochrome [Paracoccus beibuensis]|uniref:c-type cytochrome n=1 Tax=Paracoccus beibuensis TaxID=547602 RepID=UPI0022405D11|nr:c-type cytochrome [Paracoccus beibuensis]